MTEASPSLPSRARVVIIGGGVIGTSVAYHLAQLGWTDVLLLEQGQLSCGTRSWHPAGILKPRDLATDRYRRWMSNMSKSLPNRAPAWSRRHAAAIRGRFSWPATSAAPDGRDRRGLPAGM